ncbi:universal stress protein [Salinimicrobium xinjiangense]|uniref:universal stress protein n=1 Tax=Salinimicrobium xinjiangense TaxID=438596 RepID=UPI0004008850|nr:universal stress protein [Salinimicrobium xinjiangense]
MKNILIPFDFSEVSLNALEYAVKFADQDLNITLSLLHISDGKTKEEEIDKKFKDVLQKYESPLNPGFETYIRQGELSTTIINLQKELKIDLVIMGTKGAELGEEDIATRTSRFVKEADLPVLVIPEKVKTFRLNTIILTVGREKIADRSPLYVLLDVSRKFKAQVHVLTVHKSEVLSGYSEEDESNENTLQYFLEMFYSHHSFSESEDIERGILEYIERHDVDMLAIMPKTHLNNGEASQGRLTNVLTLHTNVPLLVLD